jgi:hypothetical protein
MVPSKQYDAFVAANGDARCADLISVLTTARRRAHRRGARAKAARLRRCHARDQPQHLRSTAAYVRVMCACARARVSALRQASSTRSRRTKSSRARTRRRSAACSATRCCTTRRVIRCDVVLNVWCADWGCCVGVGRRSHRVHDSKLLSDCVHGWYVCVLTLYVC